MAWSARLLIAFLIGMFLTASGAQAAPASQSRPAAQQREDRAQPDRWGRNETRQNPSADKDEDESEDSDDEDDDEDEDKNEPARHPGELNGKLDLSDWV